MAGASTGPRLGEVVGEASFELTGGPSDIGSIDAKAWVPGMAGRCRPAASLARGEPLYIGLNIHSHSSRCR